MDYLPNLPVPVKPVGRLDFYSEGVLLLTNDGELAARLLAPASHVAEDVSREGPRPARRRRHQACCATASQLDDGTVTLPAEVEMLPGESKHTWLAITIHEGKHRQIHRMIEALGYHVDKLQRVAFANLTFHGLRVGDARELDAAGAQRAARHRSASITARSRAAAGAPSREETDIRARAHARAEARGAPKRRAELRSAVRARASSAAAQGRAAQACGTADGPIAADHGARRRSQAARPQDCGAPRRSAARTAAGSRARTRRRTGRASRASRGRRTAPGRRAVALTPAAAAW